MKFADLSLSFWLGVVAQAALSLDVDGRLRSVEQVQVIQDDASTNRQCHLANANYLPALSPGLYASSAFHNCFRTADQIFELLDVFVDQNAAVLTKFPVSSTFKNKTIYGYKLHQDGSTATQTLYFQSLLHAREWIAASSAVFALSSILDDIASKKPTAADAYDLVFVPVVNIDGYDLSWNGNRYQRKNANQVDLNRNWPSYYKNPKPPRPSDETYPGPFPFSEPETKGIDTWIKAQRDEIAGFMDVHSYSGLVMYPYGDTKLPIGNGQDEKFQVLGKRVETAMGSASYTAQTSAGLYVAYGCFDDYHYRTYQKPTLTIEVAGDDFVTPASGIRTHGGEIYRGITQFAQEVAIFNGPPPSTTTPRTTPTATISLAPTPAPTAAPTAAPTSAPTPAVTTTSVPPTTAAPTTTSTPSPTRPPSTSTASAQPTTAPKTTTKPTTTKPKPSCGTCATCFYPAGNSCLSDFSKSDCLGFALSFGTVWCGN